MDPGREWVFKCPGDDAVPVPEGAAADRYATADVTDRATLKSLCSYAVRDFAQVPNNGLVQQQLNIFDGNLELLRLCDELNLASLNRGPLGMGILTGKFTPETTFAEDDVRKHADWFPGLKDSGVNREWLNDLEAIREILTSGGRTLAQGALAWIWAASPRTVPIPGFKTVAQVQENAGAMAFGPLSGEQMGQIDTILGRDPVLG